MPFFGTSWDPSQASLVRTSDMHAVPLAAWTSFRTRNATSFAPLEPLTVGDSYLFTHPRCGFGSPAPHTTLYSITDPGPTPTSPGTLTVRGPFAAYRSEGACFRYVFVQLDLDPDPAFASAPWSTFTWGGEVDGVWAPSHFVPMDTRSIQIEVSCPHAPQQVRAVVVPVAVNGAQQASEPMAPFASVPVTIDCAGAIAVDATTLRPLTPDEIARDDDPAATGCVDAGAAPMDAGTSFDGAPHTEPDTHPSCACAAHGGARPPWLVLACAAMLAMARRRPR